MRYVTIIEKFIEEVRSAVESTGSILHVSPAFPDDVKEPLSCIMNIEDSECFGIVCVNMEGDREGVEELNCFIFNGQLYEYCKAEGFTRNQMVEDSSFEDKVLARRSKKEFIEYMIDA